MEVIIVKEVTEVICPEVGRKPYRSGGETRTDYVQDYRVPLGNATGW